MSSASTGDTRHYVPDPNLDSGILNETILAVPLASSAISITGVAHNPSANSGVLRATPTSRTSVLRHVGGSTISSLRREHSPTWAT